MPAMALGMGGRADAAAAGQNRFQRNTRSRRDGDLRRNFVARQAVSLASRLSDSSQARRTVAGG